MSTLLAIFWMKKQHILINTPGIGFNVVICGEKIEINLECGQNCLHGKPNNRRVVNT